MGTVIDKGCMTADIGGNARTDDFTDEIYRQLERILG